MTTMNSPLTHSVEPEPKDEDIINLLSLSDKEEMQELLTLQNGKEELPFSDVERFIEEEVGSDGGDLTKGLNAKAQGLPHGSAVEQMKWMARNGVRGYRNPPLPNPYSATGNAERFLNNKGLHLGMSRANLNTVAAMFNKEVGNTRMGPGEVQAGRTWKHFPGGYPHAYVSGSNRIEVVYTTKPRGQGEVVKLKDAY